MNWLYLPGMKRWINLDHMASIETVPEGNDKGNRYSRKGRFMTHTRDGETHYTFPEDAAVIFERLEALSKKQ